MLSLLSEANTMTAATESEPVLVELVVNGVSFSLTTSSQIAGGSATVTLGGAVGETHVDVEFTNFCGMLRIHHHHHSPRTPPDVRQVSTPNIRNDEASRSSESQEVVESTARLGKINSLPQQRPFRVMVHSEESGGMSKHGDKTDENYNDSSVDSFDSLPLHTDSELHTMCGRPDVSLEQLRAALHANPSAACEVDSLGQCPLHILSQNESILHTEHGRDEARQFALELFDAYPKAMLHSNQANHMPFVSVIEKWVDRTYRLAQSRMASSSRSMVANLMHRTLSRLGSSFHGAEHSLHGDGLEEEDKDRFSFRRIFRHRTESLPSRTGSLHDVIEDTKIGGSGAYKLCPRTIAPPTVEWAFTMLSTILSNINENVGHSSNHDDIILVWSSVAGSLGSVPYLLKTIFLIEQQETRIRILRQPVCQRVLLSRNTVGRWICPMLHRRGFASQRAVDYFVEVSRVTAASYVGPHRTPRSADMEAFEEDRLAIFDAIGDISGVIPSLVVLDQKETERAAATDAIWHVVSLSMSRPVVVGILALDLLFHISLMFVFRFNVSHEEFDLLNGLMSASFRKGTSDALIISICVYFSLRKTSEVFALLRISKNALKAYSFDMWNLIDLAAIVLSLVSCLVNASYPWLFAITSASLWLRLLGFLKAINMEFATFILAIIEIMKDIKWFLVVLCIFIFMFGDMIHIITTRSDDNYCVDDIPPPQFCSSSVISLSYLKMYSVIVGDVALDDFSYNPGVVFLFVVFTLYCVIVLLTVLIAIVSESYEKSVMRAKFLFGRARVGFAVTHVSQEQFLQGTERPMFIGINSLCDHEYVLWLAGFVGQCVMLVCILWTFFLTEAYMIAMVINTPNQASTGLGVVSLILAVCISALLLVAMTLILQNLFQQTLDRAAGCFRLTGVNHWLHSFLHWVLQIITENLLGIQHDSRSEERGWHGKFEFLEIMMSTLISAMEKRVIQNVHASEQRVKMYESKVGDEVKAHTEQMLHGRGSNIL